MSLEKPNTVLLRLEGPLQSWGVTSRYVVRDTGREPTKSGVLGLVCCAMGLSRAEAESVLEPLNGLALAVRVDRPGALWEDYHTVGAGEGLMTAGGKIKRTATTGELESVVSTRFYLCDASFLAALGGDPAMVGRVAEALQRPVWPPFLGRKSCPPSRPIFVRSGRYRSLEEALASESWRPRLGEVEQPPSRLRCIVELRQPAGVPLPAEAFAVVDVRRSFSPPCHEARYVVERTMACPVGDPLQLPCAYAPQPRVNYRSAQWKATKARRTALDLGLCVFCKQPAENVHHVDYRRAGAEETEDLRSLCRLCHDAVSMIEYGSDLGARRIDPCDPQVRSAILAKRAEILETRLLWKARQRRS